METIKKARKIIVKGYTKDGKDWSAHVGQEVYDGHKIHQILIKKDGSKLIEIKKGNEIKPWKDIHPEVATILEYVI